MAVIRQFWTVNVHPLEELSYFVDSFNQMAFDLWQQSTAEIAPYLLDDLREYPPVPPNSTYQRTFKLRDNWTATVGLAGDGQYRLEVSNSTDYAVWVVGSLATVRETAARFQRDFHKAHGWTLASDTVSFWWEALKEEVQTRFENELAEFGGFTLTRHAKTRVA